MIQCVLRLDHAARILSIDARERVHGLLPFEIYLDPAILDNLRIAFNACRLDVSVLMPIKDYLRVAPRDLPVRVTRLIRIHPEEHSHHALPSRL